MCESFEFLSLRIWTDRGYGRSYQTHNREENAIFKGQKQCSGEIHILGCLPGLQGIPQELPLLSKHIGLEVQLPGFAPCSGARQQCYKVFNSLSCGIYVCKMGIIFSELWGLNKIMFRTAPGTQLRREVRPFCQLHALVQLTDAGTV